MDKKNLCILHTAVIFVFSASNSYAGPAGLDSQVTQYLVEGKIPQTHRVEVYTGMFELEQIYRSMKGPYENINFKIVDAPERPQLVWFTGAKLDIYEPDGMTLKSPEFLCHQQLWIKREDFNDEKFMEFGNVTRKNRRLFTMGQGQMVLDFPENFGIPLISSQTLRATSMVMNPNENGDLYRLRVKSTFDFIRDRDVEGEMKPLYLELVSVKVPVVSDDESQNFKGSHMTESEAKEVVGDWRKPRKGITGHFYVPPGRHTYSYNLGKNRFAFDTTVHFIGVHMHPFGESLELKDLTAGKVLYKSYGENYPDKEALAKLDYLKSEEGIPVYRDHEYELTTVYNNKTDRKIDVMSVMYLYLLDKNFDKNQILSLKNN